VSAGSRSRRFPEPERLDSGEPTMIAHLKGRELALEPFGLTGRRAEWIALASLHGGVFTRAQLSDWLGASRFRVLRLVQALTDRRLVAEETVGGLKVCRVCARGVYRALGAGDVRSRRIRRVRPRRSRLRHLDGAPLVAGPAPEALGGAEGGRLVGRGRRGRVRPETARPCADDPRELDRFGQDLASRASARDRRRSAARGCAHRGRHPRHGRRGGCGNGRLSSLPPPDRRDAGTAPIGTSRGHDRRPFGVAFEPPFRSPDLSAVRRSPLPIRRCENDIRVLVQGNRARVCGTRVPQVAGRLGVGPRPADRRCRSGSPGRGRERPGPSGCPVRHRGGSACARPCRPPRRVAPVPTIPPGRVPRR